MIRNIGIVKWTDDATAEQRATAVADFRALQSKVPGIRNCTVYEDAGITEEDGITGNSAGVLVVWDFEDLEGFEAYRYDPNHLAMSKSMAPIIVRAASIQVEWPGSPSTI